MDPTRRAKLDQVRMSQRFRDRLALQTRVTERGPLAFAIVDQPLEAGVIAIVHIGQSEPLTRYAVVSTESFNDDVYLRALGAAFTYEMHREDDVSPVTITLRATGEVDARSDRYGRIVWFSPKIGVVKDLSRRSGPMLALARNAAAHHVAGFGAAKIVRPEQVAEIH